MSQTQPEPTYRVIRASDAAQHTCQKPKHESVGVGPGAIIQCNVCRTYWTCTSKNYGVQHDPIDPPQLIWERWVAPANGR